MAGLNETPSGERVHIAFFGVRNAGKSSLVNAVTGQSVSIVSDVKGTTADPVKKAMELLPIGPVLIIDTPGIDDSGQLGELRAERTRQTLLHTDIAVLAVEASEPFPDACRELERLFSERNIPHITALTKADLLAEGRRGTAENEIYVSSVTGENVTELKEMLGRLAVRAKPERKLLDGLVLRGHCVSFKAERPGFQSEIRSENQTVNFETDEVRNDTVMLVMPNDGSAPKGRLILPQQQTIRELLDGGCFVMCCREDNIAEALGRLKSPPSLVITDSRVFGTVDAALPRSVPLTSFSIIFARYKGELDALVNGAARLSKLRDGDRVLISEGCTHHRQCGDIGTVLMPQWIREFCGARPEFSFTSGGDFPSAEELKGFSLVVHCGGCMLNAAEMKRRMEAASAADVPMVNYGIAIAEMHGILDRSLESFRL